MHDKDECSKKKSSSWVQKRMTTTTTMLYASTNPTNKSPVLLDHRSLSKIHPTLVERGGGGGKRRRQRRFILLMLMFLVCWMGINSKNGFFGIMTMGEPAVNKGDNEKKDQSSTVVNDSSSSAAPSSWSSFSLPLSSSSSSSASSSFTIVPSQIRRNNDKKEIVANISQRNLPTDNGTSQQQELLLSSHHNSITTMVVHANESHLYWSGRQGRLCQLLQNATKTRMNHYHHYSNSHSFTSSTTTTTPSSSSSSSSPSSKKSNPPVSRLLPRIHLNMTIQCAILDSLGGGQGNWVTAIYAVRLAALYYKVDFSFHCSDDNTTTTKATTTSTGLTDASWSPVRQRLLVPWFTGYWAWEDYYTSGTTVTGTTTHHAAVSPTTPVDLSDLTESVICSSNYQELRIDKLVGQIRQDVQQMAVQVLDHFTVLGTDYERHRDGGEKMPTDSGATGTSPRTSSSGKRPSLVSNNIVVELDDVVIHFRCGDVFGTAKRNEYGMIQFREYKKLILQHMTQMEEEEEKNSENNYRDPTHGFHTNNQSSSSFTRSQSHRKIQSIGIVTQPFNATVLLQQNPHRGVQDIPTVDACRTVTYALRDYLLQHIGSGGGGKGNDGNHDYDDVNSSTPSDRAGPSIRIRIHNTEQETLPLAYARLATARQLSVASFSSFGALAVVGIGAGGGKSDGTIVAGRHATRHGYLPLGNPPWVKYLQSAPQDEETIGSQQDAKHNSGSILPMSNLHVVSARFWGSNTIRKKGLKKTLHWLTKEQ